MDNALSVRLDLSLPPSLPPSLPLSLPPSISLALLLFPSPPPSRPPSLPPSLPPFQMENAVSVMANRAKAKDLEIAAWFKSPDIPDVVLGDPGRLFQIFMNLLGR